MKLQNEQEPANASDETLTEETNTSPISPKDLSSLVNNLEAEITLNEQHLKDENDKRYMFKVSNPINLFYQCVYGVRIGVISIVFTLTKNRWMIVDELTIMTNSFVHFCQCLPNVAF